MQYIFLIIVLLIASGWYFIDTPKDATPSPEPRTEERTNPITEPIKQATEVKEILETKNLSVLDLSGQGLTKVPEYVFGRTNLEHLNVSNNALTGALQAEVRHLQNLKILDLSHNNFTGVPAEVGQLKELEVLDLSHNKLTGLPYEIGNLQNLKVLDLTGNNYAPADLEVIKKSLPGTTRILTD